MSKPARSVAVSFEKYPTLVDGLPALVRKQRRHAAAIARVALDFEKEKATREAIDLLLLAAGLKKGEGVTCLGYDVYHNEKAGNESINEDRLRVLLLAAGTDPDFVDQLVTAATDIGNSSKFATVAPSKGAKVRVAA